MKTCCSHNLNFIYKARAFWFAYIDRLYYFDILYIRSIVLRIHVRRDTETITMDEKRHRLLVAETSRVTAVIFSFLFSLLLFRPFSSTLQRKVERKREGKVRRRYKGEWIEWRVRARGWCRLYKCVILTLPWQLHGTLRLTRETIRGDTIYIYKTANTSTFIL